MRDFSQEEIKKIQEAIAQKKSTFGEDWLGRSLAYTPYQPRPLSQVLKRDNTAPIRIIRTLFEEGKKEDFLLDAKERETTSSAFLVESLENITYLRRYVQTPLIYDFLILDSYQLLESLVYGTDCVILSPKYLNQQTLKHLSDYALKIGLERIFRISSKDDLTKAIFAKADILDISSNFSLIPLIPKNKILLSIIPPENEEISRSLDAKILLNTP